MAGDSNHITYRTPFSTDHKAIQWLFRVLTCQILIRNCFTAVLLKQWNRFSERARAIQNIRKHEAGGPRKRMLIISISRYTNGWRTLYGPKTDWKFWAMLGTMSGWNVEVLADSLPTEDSARQPQRDNIRRFARDHLRGNGKGDQFIVVYAGHCDNQGLVLADGSRISPQELRDWFVKPLALGSFLWAFFDCCESSNLLGLRHKVRCGESQTIQYQSNNEAESKNTDTQGTVVSIGSAAGASGEMDLNDPRVPNPNSEPLHCGPLAWAAYLFFHSVCKQGEPLLANFLPLLKQVLAPGEGQEPQVTTSAILQDPVLPLLGSPSSTATSA
ncbi:hypothetical protein M407DRAFT_21839 [Tulasnella calospora MUT 4182]|uniref:Peptidase C14 caspase domain-containing protein n=1 Tax=Tulasnella calospora MUT 4182 TaxID=1051891 RepID=A0A0C3QMJ6_9AGAM|nr:hypothetical protein M407DRAFT_21839 [Tulasnella calospora MUT 4182]